MKKFCTHLALTAIIFTIVYLITHNIPAINQLDISIEGWGWAVVIAMGLLVTAIQAFIVVSFAALTRNTKYEVSASVGKFLSATSDYVGYGVALFAAAALAPSLISYSSAPAVFGLAVIIGVGTASVFWLGKRFFQL